MRRLEITTALAGKIHPTQVVDQDQHNVQRLGRLHVQGDEKSQDENDISDHAAAALSAFSINALVLREPSIGSMPCPSNSIEMTPENFES